MTFASSMPARQPHAGQINLVMLQGNAGQGGTWISKELVPRCPQHLQQALQCCSSLSLARHCSLGKEAEDISQRLWRVWIIFISTEHNRLTNTLQALGHILSLRATILFSGCSWKCCRRWGTHRETLWGTFYMLLKPSLYDQLTGTQLGLDWLTDQPWQELRDKLQPYKSLIFVLWIKCGTVKHQFPVMYYIIFKQKDTK